MKTKETDKIVSKHKGYVMVVAKTKKGETEPFAQYEETPEGFKAMVEKETENGITRDKNRMKRVDAVNESNREKVEPSEITQLKRIRKDAKPDVQAAIDKDIADVLARHKAAQAA